MAAANQTPGLRFRLFGFPIEVQFAFFVIIGLLGLQAGDMMIIAIWIGVAFVSILVHELGHAFAARRFGSRPSIVLHGFGGLTSFSSGMSTGRSLIVTLAGPFAGFAAGAFVYAVVQLTEPLHGDVRVAVAFALWINIGWGLINLLPILPLDGGLALRDTIQLVTGKDRVNLVHQISIAVAVGAGVFAWVNGLMFTTLFSLYFVGTNMKALSDSKRHGQMRRLSDAADAAFHHGDAAQAVAATDALLRERPDPNVTAAALQLKAWALLGQQDPVGARAACEALPDGQQQPSLYLLGVLALAEGHTDTGLAFVVEGILGQAAADPRVLADYLLRSGCLHELDRRISLLDPQVREPARLVLQTGLHVGGHYREAADYGAAAYETAESGRGLLAYNVACSLARLGETAAALRWLETASHEGFHDPELIDNDEDLAAVRCDPGYAAVRALF